MNAWNICSKVYSLKSNTKNRFHFSMSYILNIPRKLVKFKNYNNTTVRITTLVHKVKRYEKNKQKTQEIW